MEISLDHIFTVVNPENIDDLSQSTKHSYKTKKKLKKLKKKHVETQNEGAFGFKFYSIKSNCPPKKDYLRSKMIRSHKRAIRQIATGACPSKILMFKSENCRAEELWKKFCQVYFQNQEILSVVSQTDLNYIADQRKIWKNYQSSVKSYNSKFCRNYFSEIPVRESYFYFIELVFCDFSPEHLKNKFEFCCCHNKSHNSICIDSWKNLKYFLQIEILIELNVVPWEPLQEPQHETLQVSHSQPEWINKIYINRFFSRNFSCI
ncbi:hypothetical protein SteCoe_7790 [Stentor coeruleus]|uniref:Uncharacterized protein n=1 Tax=Stentor coeruleus TaxID=5963 RepID=A0A1R2CLV5_9CILI|nr:hypothetical protein SteCoe_7790 [Stentor coeruleus]